MNEPDRRAVIEGTGPHITVRLSANNALHVSAKFAVFAETGDEPIEVWTVAVGPTGQVEHPVGTPPAQLCNGWLTWRILVCSHDAGIVQGDVAVTIRQRDTQCPMFPAALYELLEVPACESGSAIPISGEARLECS